MGLHNGGRYRQTDGRYSEVVVSTGLTVLPMICSYVCLCPCVKKEVEVKDKKMRKIAKVCVREGKK